MCHDPRLLGLHLCLCSDHFWMWGVSVWFFSLQKMFEKPHITFIPFTITLFQSGFITLNWIKHTEVFCEMWKVQRLWFLLDSAVYVRGLFKRFLKDVGICWHKCFFRLFVSVLHHHFLLSNLSTSSVGVIIYIYCVPISSLLASSPPPAFASLCNFLHFPEQVFNSL